LVPVKGEMEPITTGPWAIAELSEATAIIINTMVPKKASLFIISLLSSNEHAQLLS
jgi:hypothetical protein